MTTLFVATTGGHLAQLFELAGRMNGLGQDRLWVSFDNEQSRTLLDGEEKVFIPYIAERDVAGVLRALGYAHQIMRAPRTVTAVVSTGSAIALSFLPYAALRGIEAHYIESAAFVGQSSLTGRVLQNIPGVRLYRQYPHAARGRWKYGGSVLDGFQGVCVKPRGVKRVLVTVGTDKPIPRCCGRRALRRPKGSASTLGRSFRRPCSSKRRRMPTPSSPMPDAVRLSWPSRPANVRCWSHAIHATAK